MRHAIILAGGSGTRFWPLSRQQRPKQLLELCSDKTLLEDTVERVRDIVDQVHISTSAELEQAIERRLPDLPLIVEPARRDTAAAIGLCVAQFSDDDVLAFLPSDHHITPKDAFQQTLLRALEKAEEGGIVVIGIPPKTAHTGLGYIRPGDGDRVAGFTEKPDAARAQRFVEEGYLWNAGMFVARAGTLMEAFKRHAPDIHEHLLALRSGADAKEVFSRIRRTSIDYAIMELYENIRYVKAEFSWNDLGSFTALSEIIEGTNVSLGGAMVIDLDSHGNVVVGKKIVALIDCQDLIVAETDDALLICPKASAQKIKDLQQRLPQEIL